VLDPVLATPVVPPSSGRAGRPAPAWALATVVLVLGIGGGVLTEHLQGVLEDPWAAWANSVAAWCLPAFAVGALAARPRAATAAGVGVELLLVSGYYAAQGAQGYPVVAATLVGWLGAGVIAGVLFGLAGSWWRASTPRLDTVGIALLSGVLVSEGLVRAVRFPWQGSSGVVMAAAGVLVAVVLGRSWRQRLVVVALLLLVVPLGLAGDALANQLFAAF
jgi:hypothetical protein